MASASSCRAARTTSSTERLWPRWITSAPCDWIRRRMMLMAASWPSNRLAAVTKRSGVALALADGLAPSLALAAGVLMARAHGKWGSGDCAVGAGGGPGRHALAACPCGSGFSRELLPLAPPPATAVGGWE